MATNPAEEERLRQLESLCRAFYEGSSAEQKNAHDILLPLTSDPQYLGQLQSVLSHSSDLHALIFSANALMKLFTSRWNSIPTDQKTNTRKFLLNYLYQRGPGMVASAPIALQIFVRLLVRIIKLSWLESVQNQNVIQQVNEFFAATTAHWVVGLTIFSELTSDMQPNQGPSISRQRRTALGFKDTTLPKIAEVGVRTLRNINLRTMDISDPTEERKLLHQVLQMVNNCFSYDFMGVIPDETTEEQHTILVPLSWDFIHTSDVCNTFFDLYRKSWAATPPWPECARLCIQNLVLQAAFRKTFFAKESDRLDHVSQLIQETATILREQIGLHDDDCYHELCRLLGKINAANQFSDLAASPAFTQWLEQAHQFTMRSLENWMHLPNSKHYLLGLWSGMLNVRQRRPAAVENYIEQVTMAYIQSRMHIAEAVASDQDEIDNPLTNEVMRAEQLEALSFLGRCRYAQTAARVADLFDSTNRAGQIGSIDRETYLQKISWLVYMIGALAGGFTLAYSSPALSSSLFCGDADDSGSDDEDGGVRSNGVASPEMAHGELAVRVFQLIAETDSHPQAWSEQLELAYLNFLEEFRKYLIFAPSRPPLRRTNLTAENDDHVGYRTATKRICELMGLQQEEDVTSLIVRKAVFNLQRRTEHETVIKQSLHLLMVLCSGMSLLHSGDRMPHLVMSGRVLLKDQAIRDMMRNHSSDEFSAFLSNPRYSKYRTSYFSSLTRLLLLDLKNESNGHAAAPAGGSESALDSPRFYEFMDPFARVFSQFNYLPGVATTTAMAAATGATAGSIGIGFSAAELANPAFKAPLIGLFRDLRGVCMACHSPDAYLLFFNWMVNRPKVPAQSRIRLLSETAQAWWDDHEVTVPLLRLASDLVYNKSSRISFDSSSASGLVLFKEVSTILLSYGTRILTKSFGGDSVSTAALSAVLFREKYKGLAVALEMFSNTLAGNYTNFGVFELYNDSILSNSLSLAFQMCLAIPNEDLQAFLKSLKPVYTFLEVVTRNFMAELLNLETHQLAVVIRTLEDGLCAFDNGISMQCCAALDHVIKYMFSNRELQTEEGEAVRKFFVEQPESLKRILQVVFQLMMSGEVASTWSLSRPLLGLILLHEEEFLLIKNHFTQSPQFDAERREKLVKCFDELMIKVARDISPKNKDVFTKNLFQFTHNLRSNVA